MTRIEQEGTPEHAAYLAGWIARASGELRACLEHPGYVFEWVAGWDDADSQPDDLARSGVGTVPCERKLRLIEAARKGTLEAPSPGIMDRGQMLVIDDAGLRLVECKGYIEGGARVAPAGVYLEKLSGETWGRIAGPFWASLYGWPQAALDALRLASAQKE